MTHESKESDAIYARAVDEFREFYNTEVTRLQSASASMATLLELLLTDHPSGFPTPSILSRVKRLNECEAKFDRKYREKLSLSNNSYSIRDHISDLIGLRAVCLYDDEIRSVQSVIEQEFEIIGITDKTLEMEKHDDVFGYKAVHLDVRLNDVRRHLPEYRRISDLRFEIQVRSTIQDSWSKLDHHVKYKKDLPSNLRRRIHRLAALFELADQEFRLIREERNSLAPSFPANPPQAAIPTQPESLGEAVIQIGSQIYGKYPFTPAQVGAFAEEIRKFKNDASGSWLKEAVARHQESILEYKEYQRITFMARMNPYTFVRHALFAEDSKIFSRLLFPRQLESYKQWVKLRATGEAPTLPERSTSRQDSGL